MLWFKAGKLIKSKRISLANANFSGASWNENLRTHYSNKKLRYFW